MKNIILLYLLVINIVAYQFMRIDKERARKKVYRISEKTLFLLSFFGGSAGSLVGMYRFRHKTKHKKFIFGIPLLLIINIVVILKILI